MRLHRLYSAHTQIREAVADGTRLFFDIRKERAGDRAACVAVAHWLADTHDAPLTFVESMTAPTEFSLSNYKLPFGLDVEFAGPVDELPGLDIHTPGMGADALWLLGPHAGALGYHGGLHLLTPRPRTAEVLFCLLSGTAYNERRDMDLWHARRTINTLRDAGYDVTVLYDRDSPLFPDALRISLHDCVERIATAGAVIAGDTGFSHIAAAFGTPLVALYPDWPRHGMTDLATSLAVSEWWEVPAWNYTRSFMPNAPYERLRVVQLLDDHRWSIQHVEAALNSLALCS